MLVLTRRPNESIVIANNIKITVVSVGPGRVKLGIEAPSNVRIDRQEIHDKIEHSADALADVLAAVAGGEATSSDAQNTFIVGPDTAMIVPATPAETPAQASMPAAAAPSQPPLSNLNRLSKYRLPRKPR